MRNVILVAGLVVLSGCVDPLPVGTETRFGTVEGAAPPEAVGPGPFLTGGGGPGAQTTTDTRTGSLVTVLQPRRFGTGSRDGVETPEELQQLTGLRRPQAGDDPRSRQVVGSATSTGELGCFNMTNGDGSRRWENVCF